MYVCNRQRYKHTVHYLIHTYIHVNSSLPTRVGFKLFSICIYVIFKYIFGVFVFVFAFQILLKFLFLPFAQPKNKMNK